MNKSMLNTRVNTATAVAAAGQLPLGSAVHGLGCGIKLNGNAITITEAGSYKIIANATYAITGTNAVEVDMLANNVVIARASETPSATGAIANVTPIGTVHIKCNCLAPVTITFTASEAGTLNELDVLVERM